MTIAGYQLRPHSIPLKSWFKNVSLGILTAASYLGRHQGTHECCKLYLAIIQPDACLSSGSFRPGCKSHRGFSGAAVRSSTAECNVNTTKDLTPFHEVDLFEVRMILHSRSYLDRHHSRYPATGAD